MYLLKIILSAIAIVLAYIFVAPFVGIFCSKIFDVLVHDYYALGHMFPSLIPGFFLFNLGIAYLTIRWTHTIHFSFAFLAATAASWSIDYVLGNNLYNPRDAYGMKTAIALNAVIPIFLLLLTLMIKKMRFSTNDTSA